LAQRDPLIEQPPAPFGQFVSDAVAQQRLFDEDPRLRFQDAALGSLTPSLRVLAERFGKPSNDRAYTLRDLEWKWQDMYLEQEPDIGAPRGLDDLGSGVLRK